MPASPELLAVLAKVAYPQHCWVRHWLEVTLGLAVCAVLSKHHQNLLYQGLAC